MGHRRLSEVPNYFRHVNLDGAVNVNVDFDGDGNVDGVATVVALGDGPT